LPIPFMASLHLKFLLKGTYPLLRALKSSAQRAKNQSTKTHRRELKYMSHDTDRDVEVVGGGKRVKSLNEEEIRSGVKIVGQHPSPGNVRTISKNEPDEQVSDESDR
jgi:hypothetical protein